MHTLFLVEDEVIELDLLREHIDWSSMGIRIVGSARNGRAAWERIQSLQPDIVLTDVRMPIMDGLQLAALIRERFDWMKVVFLSGHDEFSYVKSALSSGAVGYLLKPIDPDEMSDVIGKVKEEARKADWVRRSKDMMADKQIGDILRAGAGGNGSASVEEAWHALIQMAPEYEQIHFVSALLEVDQFGFLPEPVVQRLKEQDDIAKRIRSLLHAFSLKGTWIRLDAHRWFLVIRGDDDGAEAFWRALSDAVREELDGTATIGVSGQAYPLAEAGRLYGEAERALRMKFYEGHGRVILYSRDAWNEERADIETIFGSPALPDLSDLSPYEEEIGQFFERLRALRVPQQSVYRSCRELLAGMSAELSKYEDWAGTGIGSARDWWREITRYDTLSGIKDYVYGLLGRIGGFLEEKRQDRHAVLVRQVAEIIDGEYSAPLTIEYLAGRVYLSPNYLRALFKEKKGITVHDYLSQVRLRKAVELLRDKRLKIHDVARQVGYDNTSYFCSFFYKSQGVTPNEYRKKFL